MDEIGKILDYLDNAKKHKACAILNANEVELLVYYINNLLIDLNSCQDALDSIN